jgi:hypothetical protein
MGQMHREAVLARFDRAMTWVALQYLTLAQEGDVQVLEYLDAAERNLQLAKDHYNKTRDRRVSSYEARRNRKETHEERPVPGETDQGARDGQAGNGAAR